MSHNWLRLVSDWMKKWREFLKPIVSQLIQNQLLFDTQMKSTLQPFLALIIYMKKLLDSDWLRTVQFFLNTVQKRGN